MHGLATLEETSISDIHLPARTGCAVVVDAPHSEAVINFQDTVLRVQGRLACTTLEHHQGSQLKAASPPYRQTALVVDAQCILNL